MKKAFCEPGNIMLCPPIALASAFGFPLGDGTITIERAEENGGNVEFKTRAELEAAFQAESLHPGDLKNKTSSIMVTILEKLAQGLAADVEATKAAKTLKALHKKLAKSK
jgi:tyrosyl-tRNA synthetase